MKEKLKKGLVVFLGLLLFISFTSYQALAQVAVAGQGQQQQATVSTNVGGYNIAGSEAALMHPQPSMMTSAGFPNLFPLLPYGFNLGSMLMHVTLQPQQYRGELERMLADFGGNGKVMLNGQPFEVRPAATAGPLLVLTRLDPRLGSPVAALVAYGKEGHGQKKKAFAQQCFAAVALEALSRGANVLLLQAEGHDGKLETDATGVGIGITVGGPGGGGTSISGTIGFRKDWGSAGFSGQPYLMALACAVPDSVYQKLVKERDQQIMAEFRKASGAKEVVTKEQKEAVPALKK